MSMHAPTPRTPCFVTPALPLRHGSPPHTTSILRRSRPCTCAIRASATPSPTPPSPSSPPSPAMTPIPGSLESTSAQAAQAVRGAQTAGLSRTFVMVDTTNGDETYTLLKGSLPFTRLFASALATPTDVILPDAGAAALAARDWERDGTRPDGVGLHGLERWRGPGDDVADVVIVAPRASEVGGLEVAVGRADGRGVVLVNADLVDMGVTGLSLNARQLRERLIDSFETAYYLKVQPWGIMVRAWPAGWTVYVDDDADASGFRPVGVFDEKPDAEALERVLDGEGADAGGGWVSKLSRFLSLYMKG